jgi:hypothetical protein
VILGRRTSGIGRKRGKAPGVRGRSVGALLTRAGNLNVVNDIVGRYRHAVTTLIPSSSTISSTTLLAGIGHGRGSA